MLHEDMARGGGADGVVPGGNDKDKEDTASQSPNTNFREHVSDACHCNAQVV